MNPRRYTSVRERAHLLRQRSEGLRSDSKQLREAATSIQKVLATILHRDELSRPASPEPQLGDSRPAMAFITQTIERARRAREEAKAVRSRTHQLREEAGVVRSQVRIMGGQPGRDHRAGRAQ